MSGGPVVSVIMTSYNHARYLPMAIDSVLGQSVREIELVVADDGSTDESLEVAEQYADRDPRVRIVTHPARAHLGIGATVDLARSVAGGRYVLGLPSDDVLHPDALMHEVAFLNKADRDVGYVYGFAHIIDEHGRRLSDARTFGGDITRGGRAIERLVQGNVIPAMTVLWRRECMEQTGAWDRTLVYSDWEFEARAAAHWDVAFLPRALAGHRHHKGSTSLDASPATHLRRSLAVTRALREQAPTVGGRLGEPRIRATLELQLGYLLFGAAETGGESHVRAAFDRDPSLASDGAWLGSWLWSRTFDELVPEQRPDFVNWLLTVVTPLLNERAGGDFRRAGMAAAANLRAVRLARAGSWFHAHRMATAAGAHSPRKVWDRRLGAVLLDSLPTGLAAKAVRRTKRHLRPDR